MILQICKAHNPETFGWYLNDTLIGSDVHKMGQEINRAALVAAVGLSVPVVKKEPAEKLSRFTVHFIL